MSPIYSRDILLAYKLECIESIKPLKKPKVIECKPGPLKSQISLKVELDARLFHSDPGRDN